MWLQLDHGALIASASFEMSALNQLKNF